jgi:hypothetical protein
VLVDVRASVEDLLVFGGEEDKVEKGRAGLRMVGGPEAKRT